jgi:hypothetical protein
MSRTNIFGTGTVNYQPALALAKLCRLRMNAAPPAPSDPQQEAGGLQIPAQSQENRPICSRSDPPNAGIKQDQVFRERAKGKRGFLAAYPSERDV